MMRFAEVSCFQTSGNKLPTSKIKMPTSGNKLSTSEIKTPTSEIKLPTSGIKTPTSEIKTPTSGNKTPSIQAADHHRFDASERRHQGVEATHENMKSWNACIRWLIVR